jgi:hypothetical protein
MIAEAIRVIRMITGQMIATSTREITGIRGRLEMIAEKISLQMYRNIAGDLRISVMRSKSTEVLLFLSSERLPTSWATGHRGWPRSLWSRGLKRDGAMGWP